MNPLQLLIDFAADILRLSAQLGEPPARTIEQLAAQIGIDPVAATWLIITLAHLKTDRPSLYVAAVERPGASDADSVIFAYSQASLDAALEEENRIFYASPDDQADPLDVDESDRTVIHYGQVPIR